MNSQSQDTNDHYDPLVNRNLYDDFNSHDYVNQRPDSFYNIWAPSTHDDLLVPTQQNFNNNNNEENMIRPTYTPLFPFPEILGPDIDHDSNGTYTETPHSSTPPHVETMLRCLSEQSMNMDLCDYCDSPHHRVDECDQDSHLIDLFYQETKPDFFRMDYKKLKRLASHIGTKSHLPKLQLAIRFTRTWEYNNKKPYHSDDCAICMERLRKVNVGILPCGHEFCLGCLIKHTRRSDCCPLCRSNIGI